MASPRGGTRPGAGRRPGSKNKATLEREERVRLERENAQRNTESVLVAAEPLIDKALANKKLAKEELEEIVPIVKGVLAHFQPTPPKLVAQGVAENPNGSWDKFQQWLGVYIDALTKLAPYQSPRLSAVIVGQTQVTNIKVEGGLPDLDQRPTTLIEGHAEPVSAPAIAAPAPALAK